MSEEKNDRQLLIAEMLKMDPPEPLDIGQVLALCRLDPTFRSDFLANPRYILERYHVKDIPTDVPLHVVEVPLKTIVIAINPLIENPEPLDVIPRDDT
jgi:hypothetical protein